MYEQYREILNVDEAAEALCIGKNRLYSLLQNGTLKGYRNGRNWCIPKASIVEYVCSMSNVKTEFLQY